MFNFATGLPTLKTRVEAWECDFNNHWNTKFYLRSFQAAAGTVRSLSASGGGGTGFPMVRHCRFHRELLSGDAPSLYSHVVRGGAFDGWVAHFMMNDGGLAATGLDPWTGPRPSLPEISAEDAAPALPRGLTESTIGREAFERPGSRAAELGPVAQAEIGHDGAILVEELIRRFGAAAHDHIAGAGQTFEFIRGTGIGRMLVECRLTVLGTCAPGTCLRALSRFGEVAGKSFQTRHALLSHDGEAIALLEMCLLCVDMTTRRATTVPEFIARMMERRGGEAALP